MSDTNFAAIGQLVTEARNLLDSIKGGAIRVMETQFEALKQQFNNKLNSVSGELASFVSQQKANVNSIFSEPDKRYQVLLSQSHSIFVGGTIDNWYPVVIDVPSTLSRLSITRYAHSDEARFGKWNGSIALDMFVSNPQYGGGVGAAIVERYKVGGKSTSRQLPDSDVPYIGRISAGARPFQFVIWLRGETSYFVSSEDGQADIQILDDGVPVPGPTGYETLQPKPVSEGVHSSVPEVGYQRGIV